jgi:predicted ABC-class ATPase
VTQIELITPLESTGYPVAYHHFIVNEENPLPTPPYIIYIRAFDNNISSDSKVHGKFKFYQVELYTVKKDLVAEKKLETVLNNINSEYETSEIYIEEQALYQVVYQIKVIEKL